MGLPQGSILGLSSEALALLTPLQRFTDTSAPLGTEWGPEETKALNLIISEQHLVTNSQ